MSEFGSQVIVKQNENFVLGVICAVQDKWKAESGLIYRYHVNPSLTEFLLK